MARYNPADDKVTVVPLLVAGKAFRDVVGWRLQSGEEIMSRKVDVRTVRLPCFSPEGKTLTVLNDSGGLQCWGVSTVEPNRDPKGD